MKKKEQTDQELITQYLAGEGMAMAMLVKRYHRIFCDKAYWIIKDRNLAKDIAQDSWITIIDKIDQLKNIDQFKSWASKIVYTKAIDVIKKRAQEEQLKSKRNLVVDVGISKKQQDELIITKILAAIKRLPKGQQDVVRLFYKEEYSINEISQLLGIPKGTVKSRLYNAREQLKSTINRNK